jgi:hypothetical protein
MRDLSVIQKHPKGSCARRKFTMRDLVELLSGFSGLENKTGNISTYNVTLGCFEVITFTVE